MEPTYAAEAEAFRTTVRSFIEQHRPPSWQGVGALSPDDAASFIPRWRAKLNEHGYLAASWPVEYGGAGLTKVEQVVLVEELARAGLPTGATTDTYSIKMLGNTLLRWGTEEQRRHFLPRILSGQDVWCQGYSEPDAGSDLAGIRTRARLDGGRWIIDGQKIWTSSAMAANWIFLLARTDPDSQRNRGITFLLCPLDQPGIERRPIRMLNGEEEFCEVYFNGAETAAEHVIGPAGEGWTVAMTLLGHERGEEASINPVNFRAELDRLIDLARRNGRIEDPAIRARLADCHVRVEVMRFLGYRILTQYLREGELGPASSVSKLYWSTYHQIVGDLALDILGPDALVPTGRRPPRVFRADDPGAPNSSASWVGAFFNSRAGTIYAGASEIQRNIIGERALGLPKG